MVSSLMANWLLSVVQTDCEIGDKVFRSDNRFVDDNDAERVERIVASRPSLCLVREGAERGRLAMLSFGTNAHYLYRGHKKDFDIWHFFLERAKWARNQSLPYYVWLGQVEAAPNPETCAEPATGGLVLRTLAMLTLFASQKHVDAILYVDLDAVPAPPSARRLAGDGEIGPSVVTAYLELSTSADLIAQSNPREPIVANSGLLLVRRSTWSVAFLEEWWKRSCSFNDQLALWSALFETWSRHDCDFLKPETHPILFSNYSIARRQALSVLVHAMDRCPQLRQFSRKDAYGQCRDTCEFFFHKTGCLVEPLLLPKVLLLPAAPFEANDGKVLAPLQGTGSYALFCHGDYCTDAQHMINDPNRCPRQVKKLRAKGNVTYVWKPSKHRIPQAYRGRRVLH